MKAPKPLKELPGFDDALARAVDEKGHYACYDFERVGDVVIPGLQRVIHWFEVCQLAMIVFNARFDESRRIRLVPPPRLAANDCEETNG